MKKLLTLFTYVMLVLGAMAASKPIVLVGPVDYYVFNISPNGKWACGVFNFDQITNHAFRWNLQTNEIESLGDPNDNSQAWSITDDGVAAGYFTSYTALSNGVGAVVPGYYDGEWHMLELPAGASVDDTNSRFYFGEAFGISANGEYICGTVVIDGFTYTPHVWKNGKVVQKLDIAGDFMPNGMAHCISPDGQLVGGWSQGDYSRQLSLWKTSDGTRKIISKYQWLDADVYAFSPDGKKVILTGGYDATNSNNMTKEAIYDVETGEMTFLPGEPDLYAISSSYTCVGSSSIGAAIYLNGKGSPQSLRTYLQNQGVNFSQYGVSSVQIGRAISADDNVFGLQVTTPDGEFQDIRPMIVMLNQDADHGAPISVVARQLAGLATAELTWKAPFINPEGVEKYTVACDGKKIAELSKTTYSYYAEGLSYGDHVFTVTSVYADGTEMQSQSVSLKMVKQETQKPENLYARQKGMADAIVEWERPLSNFISKRWYDPAKVNFQGFGYGNDNGDIELGIGFKASEMKNYKGYELRKVNFYPNSPQTEWYVRVYEYRTPETPTLVYEQPITQTLNYKERNTVELTTPFAISGDYDMIVAIGVKMEVGSADVIGIDYGNCTPGYSDLIRQKSEPDFFSYYNFSAMYGSAQYDSFLIDAIIAPAGTNADADVVKGYELSVNGKKTLSLDAQTMSAELENSINGTATIGVKALYADGSASADATTEVTVNKVYKAVATTDIKVVQTGEDAVNITWAAPLDDDLHEVTYAGSMPGTTKYEGAMGTEENNYGLMAGVLYPSSKLKSLNGYRVDAVKFYPTADAVFTFMLFDNDEQVAEIEVEDYQLNKWNTIKLPEEIFINSHHTYMLALDCYDVEPASAPLAMDTNYPFMEVSDLVSVDNGASWVSVAYEGGLYGNWMMSMSLVDPDTKEAPITSYNVNIDNKIINPSPLYNPEYDHTGLTVGKKHTMRILSYYTGRTSAVASQPYDFTLSTFDGIESVISNTANDAPVYNLLGQRVSKANGIVIKNGKKSIIR